MSYLEYIAQNPFEVTFVTVIGLLIFLASFVLVTDPEPDEEDK